MFNEISEKGFHSFDLGEPDCWLEIDCRTIFDGPIYTGQLSLSASDGKTITLEPPSSLAASVIYKLPAILPTGSAYLQTDVSGNMSWSTGIGGNSNITGLNIGSGIGVFFAKSGDDLQFRTLVPGPGIIISSSFNQVYISASNFDGILSASNLGNGYGTFADVSGNLLRFKSLVAGPNVTINTNANQIEISASNPGEVNTASNLGTGAGVYSTKLGSDLRFKSLVAGPNVTINSTSDQIEISGSSSGEANTASNLNPNFGLFAQKTGIDLQFKTLIAGSGITLVSSSNDITISSPGGSGEANTASNLGSGFGVYQQKSGVDLQFRSISAPTSSFGNINIVTSSTDIQIVSRPQSETIRMFEDWYAGSVTGHWNWLATNSGTGAATSLVSTGVDSTTIKAIGVIQSTTGTTATGRAAQGQNLVSFRLDNLKNSVMEWRVAVPTLSTALEEFGISFGWLGLVTATAQTNGLYFFYNRLTHGDFWTTVSANGAVRTITASAVAVVANTWTKFRIETNSGLTQARFYINDVLVREESTNLPIGTGKLVGPAQVIVKSVGTTAVTFLNDYIDLTAHHIVGR